MAASTGCKYAAGRGMPRPYHKEAARQVGPAARLLLIPCSLSVPVMPDILDVVVLLYDV